MGTEVHYTVTADAVPISLAYQHWLESVPEPLFGSHPDARLMTILEQEGKPPPAPVLDIGAGMGRNSLSLARLGFSVDAVEITPTFADALATEATANHLAIRVIKGDIFEQIENLRHDYFLMLLSGVVGDLRGNAQLRRIFEVAAERLRLGGLLLLNMHIAKNGYVPDPMAHQWGQQCCATLFTRSDIAQTMAGLPLRVVADDAAHDFEKQHLPDVAWPPTPAYSEWALGQHMVALDRAQCPIELRWLVLRKYEE